MSQVKGAPTPQDEDDDVTELQEKILGLLEEAGIDTPTNDAIVRLIEAAEKRKAHGEQTVEYTYCARCDEAEPVENSCARQYGYI